MNNTHAGKPPQPADDPTPQGFTHRLLELRKQRQLSPTELGDRVGLHYTHISRYERGISRPSADTLTRLADVLGVSTDYLMADAPDAVARARVADRESLRQFQEVEQLAEEDKLLVKKFLDAFLTKKHLQELAAR